MFRFPSFSCTFKKGLNIFWDYFVRTWTVNNLVQRLDLKLNYKIVVSPSYSWTRHLQKCQLSKLLEILSFSFLPAIISGCSATQGESNCTQSSLVSRPKRFNPFFRRMEKKLPFFTKATPYYYFCPRRAIYRYVGKNGQPNCKNDNCRCYPSISTSFPS